MADLETVDQERAESTCCSPSARETCCEPEAKGGCCGPAHEAGTCGCGAGSVAVPDDADEVRETVRDRYAKAAAAAAHGPGGLLR